MINMVFVGETGRETFNPTTTRCINLVFSTVPPLPPPNADTTPHFITSSFKVVGGAPLAQEQEGSLRAATQPPWMLGGGECIVNSKIGLSYVDATCAPHGRLNPRTSNGVVDE